MEFIGISKEALALSAKARLFAARAESFTVVGERGVGKSHFARFVHEQGLRRIEPFIVFDVLSAQNIEKGLFGAKNAAHGAIVAAKSGTLLIKNLHAVPIVMQPQLVATIELGGYRPAGSGETLSASCRFVFSLPCRPGKFVEKRAMIPELAQVVSRNVVEIPPLKERNEDVEPLAGHFIKTWCKNLGIAERPLTKSAAKLLKRANWRGNVSELQVLILKTLISFSEETIDTRHLQLKIDSNWHPHTDEHLEEIALEDIVEKKLRQFLDRLGKYDVENLHGAIMARVERPLIKLAMERSKNNQLKAARILGINRNTLRAKLQKLEI